MKPFIRKKLPFILIAVQAALIIGLLAYIVPGRYRLYDIVLYDASEQVPANPLIGYAPDARDQEACEGTDLVFLEIPFSAWEPREGVFDTEGIEAAWHLAGYKEAGKRGVLRFVCDLPGEEAHRDIPDWLFEKTGGTPYDDASGKGFSPDYGDPVFIEAHGEALQALADWCRAEGFVAYVEMGSIGQHGDWAAFAPSLADPSPGETGAGSQASVGLPDQVQQAYADQYARAFPAEGDIRLLAGAQDGLAAAAGDLAAKSPQGLPLTEGSPDNAGGSEGTGAAGAWQDILGDAQAMRAWVDSRIAPASPLSQTEDASGKKESAPEADVPPLWTTRPVGAGFTQEVSMEELLMGSLSDTLAQIRESHISFIGPCCPDAAQQQTNGSEMVLRNVGYCIYLSRLQTTVDFLDDTLLFHLTFENIGNAPLYWDWPVTMHVYDLHRHCLREEVLDIRLSQLLPGKAITATGTVPYSRDLLDGYCVGISVTSPDGSQHITLAQKGVIPNARGIHRLYMYKKSR